MKIPTKYQRAALLFALSASCMTTSPLAVAAGVEKKNDKGFIEKMEQWQDKMTDKFRDAWKGLRDNKEERSIATASVDLREQKDSYTVRLNLPNRDLEKVEIKLDGDELHIVAPADDKAGRYEQTVALAGVARDAKPQIERKQKDNLIVVTVPKSSSVAESGPSLIPDPSLAPLSDWDRDIFDRMKKMGREMDRIFDDSFREFRTRPEHKGFFDRPRFGSSLDLQEEGDNYVVRAYLPERDMANVNVTIENNTILKIEAKSEDADKKEDKGVVKSRKTHYAQVLTLPGPVQADKMKVDKKEAMLVVAQRLVRRLCPACRRPEPPTADEAQWLRLCGQPVPDKTWRADGCAKCGPSGYRGRIGIFEIHRLRETDADLILAHVDEHTLRRHLRGRGALSLLEDHLQKVAEGITSIGEFRAVGGMGFFAGDLAAMRRP